MNMLVRIVAQDVQLFFDWIDYNDLKLQLIHVKYLQQNVNFDRPCDKIVDNVEVCVIT